MPKARLLAASLQQHEGIVAETGPGKVVAYVQQSLNVSLQRSDKCAQVSRFTARKGALGHHAEAKRIKRESFVDHILRIVRTA
jgi:hypothetical protein